LIAYDGRDVRDNDINLNRLLVPLAKVSVRLRHDGRVREVPVTIGEAPSRVAQRRSDEVNDGRTIVISPSPDGPFPQRIPMPVPGGARGATTFTFVVQGVAGAQLATVSADLRKSLKLSEGVLVTSAPVGSPAAMSGLKDGDVLVKVGDSQVRTVNDVRRAVGYASENGQRAIDVVLVRDKATLTKTLRW
jgi:S1-C subfamily serine protease